MLTKVKKTRLAWSVYRFLGLVAESAASHMSYVVVVFVVIVTLWESETTTPQMCARPGR